MKTVNILLSSYNGQLFLPGLIASIGAQRRQPFVLHVRDDGSTDDTVHVLKKLYRCAHIHRIEAGANIGEIRSFFQLLKNADQHAHYFAFADQDDIWHADKLECAVNALERLPEAVPALYCSRLGYIDENGVALGLSPLPKRGPSFANALVENIAAGCTIVMNRAAKDLILEGLPASCVMHDWWCYLVVAAFGRVLYDDTTHISYRLHGQNTVGAPLSFWENCVRRAGRFVRKGPFAYQAHAQAIEFSKKFGCRLPPDKLRVLDTFIRSRRSLRARCRYAWYKEVYRQSMFDDIILRILICLGRY